jgi:hypothetical protein
MQFHITWIKSPHESYLDQPHSGRLLQAKDLLTFPYRRCQRLFTQDWLTGRDTCGDVLSMRRIARGDNDGINLG